MKKGLYYACDDTTYASMLDYEKNGVKPEVTIQPNALESQYYDSYTYDGSSPTTNHGRGRLGDATKETLATLENGTGGWNSDYSYFVNTMQSWFFRGGDFSDGSNAGVFVFSSDFGDIYSNDGSRSVLVLE